MADALERLFATQDIAILDGATGTELERRGFPTALPLWTADAALRAPDLLAKIHRDYLEAGADIVTANTFRTHPYTLRRTGREAEARDLTSRSVAIARAACIAAGHGIVAGSIAPLEDCYHPERVPAPEVTREAHARHVANLVEAGADLLLVETMGTAREAHAAAEAGLATSLPVLVSFIVRGEGPADLLSGEDLEVAWAHLRALEVNGRRIAGCLVNCAPAAATLEALDRMDWPSDPRPIGAFANRGAPDAANRWDAVEGSPGEWADWGRAAVTRGARILGGCCGTTPEHIRALAAALRR